MIADLLGSSIASATSDRYLAVQLMPRRVKARTILAVDDKLRSVAIVLDLVNPVVACWWGIDEGREHWLDEDRTHRTHWPKRDFNSARWVQVPELLSASASLGVLEWRKL